MPYTFLDRPYSYSLEQLMTGNTIVQHTLVESSPIKESPGTPCILVIFGASGDLTKRLLMPALYNLACDRLLPPEFAVVGLALDELSSDQFRARMSADIKTYSTRKTFDAGVWDK